MTREAMIAKEARSLSTSVYTNEITHNAIYDVLLIMADYVDSHPKNPWRDAKKDPPREYENVLVITNTGTPTCGYIENGEFVLDADYLKGYVQYWMSIPESPKQKED